MIPRECVSRGFGAGTHTVQYVLILGADFRPTAPDTTDGGDADAELSTRLTTVYVPGLAWGSERLYS
jgi:hypothetical protein